MTDDTRALLSPGKLAVQLLGFAVGAALLVLVIRRAIQGGGWHHVANADPTLLAALLGCTVISAAINGASFWITVQPVCRVPFGAMQRINLVANMLNYAPVRLGGIVRVLYHVRVDGLTLLQIGAWFSVVAYILVLGIASCVFATLIHFQVDWFWGLLVAAQMLLGVLAIRMLAGVPLIEKYGRGLDRMVGNRVTIWTATGLRAADLVMYSTRMGIAAAILGIQLSPAQIVVLAIVALSASLIPFGRVGFREFCVAAVALQMNLAGTVVNANMSQLALVESAGEALVYIPLGILALPWLRRRLRSVETRKATEGQGDGS